MYNILLPVLDNTTTVLHNTTNIHMGLAGYCRKDTTGDKDPASVTITNNIVLKDDSDNAISGIPLANSILHVKTLT